VENEKVIKLADCAKGYTELVFTGRNPAGELLSRADYITEMVCTRHPFEKGVNAREGIEF
jgi:cob(I)alamin adenosyltransferase